MAETKVQDTQTAPAPIEAPLPPVLSIPLRHVAEATLARKIEAHEMPHLAVIASHLSSDAFAKTIRAQRTSVLSLADVATLTEHYGEKWTVLYHLITPYRPSAQTRGETLEFEAQHRPHLIRIAPYLNDSDIIIFHGSFFALAENRKLFAHNPEGVVALVERYGSGGLPMLTALGTRALNLSPEDRAFYDSYRAAVENDRSSNFLYLVKLCDSTLVTPQHRKTILELAGHLKEHTGYFLSDVTENLLINAPQRLIQVASRLTQNAQAFMSTIGDNLAEMDDETLEKMLRLYEEVDSDYESLPLCLSSQSERDRLHQSLDGFLDLIATYGKHGSALIKAFGYDAAKFTPSQHQELLRIQLDLSNDDAEEKISHVFEAISPSLFRARPGLYGDLVEQLGYDALEVVEAIKENPHFAAEQPELLKHACKHLGRFASEFIPHATASMPKTLVQFATRAITRIGTDAAVIFEVAPHEALTEKRFEYLAHLDGYEYCFAPLLRRFGAAHYFELEETYRARIEKIIALTPAGAPEIFKHVPPELWGDHRLHKAIGVYEEATGLEYSARGRYFFDQETEALTALRLRCKEEFGIRHFYRFCPSRHDGVIETSIIERNLRYLEAGPSHDRPFYVRVFPRSDWNGAFMEPIRSSELLTESHVIFYLEAGSVDETSQLLKKFSALRGVDNSGEPLHPLEHITISSHANNEEMVPGYRTPTERHGLKSGSSLPRASLRKSDIAILEEWSGYVTEGGTIALDGCLTALGGMQGDNFANSVKRAIPNVQVLATRDPVAGIDEYIVDAQGSIVNVKFNDNPRGTVKVGEMEDA